eukprot:9319293-Pyramimonas_sp.AAC.1
MFVTGQVESNDQLYVQRLRDDRGMTTTERAWATQALVGYATLALGEHQDLALLFKDYNPSGDILSAPSFGTRGAAQSEAPPMQAITVMLMGREERKRLQDFESEIQEVRERIASSTLPSMYTWDIVLVTFIWDAATESGRARLLDLFGRRQVDTRAINTA